MYWCSYRAPLPLLTKAPRDRKSEGLSILCFTSPVGYEPLIILSKAPFRGRRFSGAGDRLDQIVNIRKAHIPHVQGMEPASNIVSS